MNQSSTPLTFIQGTAPHRAWQALWWAVFAAVVIAIPFVLNEFRVGQFTRAMIFMMAILGVNLVIGYSGLLALAQSAFVGIGAFISAILVLDQPWGISWQYWMTVPVALLVAFLVGVLIGIPALRIKGLYLALITISFAAVFPLLLKIDKWGIEERTGGPNGRPLTDDRVTSPFGFLEDFQYRYFIGAIMVAFSFWAVKNLLRSRPGRAIVAIRDNETGAAVSGVNLPLYKTMTFGVSGMIGAFAGILWTIHVGFVQEASFAFLLAIDLLVGLVVGGVATLRGPVMGGLVVVFVKWWASSFRTPSWWPGFLDAVAIEDGGPLGQAILGLLLIIVAFFAPGGLQSLATKIYNRLVTVIPVPPVDGGLARVESALAGGGALPEDFDEVAEAVTEPAH